MQPVTRVLAAYAANSTWKTLPDHIRAEATRAFLNWFGCALGGSGEDMLNKACAAIAATGGAAQASILGRGARTDMVSAAFLNCLSSSALAYDDTHLATVTHPTGPVAAALLAYSETTLLSGAELLNALALGIELQCRMSNVLLMPPAKANTSLYITGITGPIGAAAAIGRVMRLDERRMRWAIGHAATQGAGFRATHGAMSGLMVPAYAARAGLFAAHLAANGVDCMENILEAPMGFVQVHASDADFYYATDGLGEQFEMLANAYKPYPSGIVVHPVIDACRDIAAQLGEGDEVKQVRLQVHPLAIRLADRKHPKDVMEAIVSIQHWAAAVFVRDSAGIAEMRQDAIDDPAVIAFRERVTAIEDSGLERDQARAEALLSNGRTVAAFVEHASGSVARPMSDDDLDRKFLGQCGMVFDAAKSNRILALLRALEKESDVGTAVSAVLNCHHRQ